MCVPTTAGGAAVDEMGERLFLARRLGVEVDEDRVGALLQLASADLVVDARNGQSSSS